MKTISMPIEEYEAELKKAKQDGIYEGQRHFVEFLERSVMTQDRFEFVKRRLNKYAKDNKAHSVVERVDRILTVFGMCVTEPIMGEKNGE